MTAKTRTVFARLGMFSAAIAILAYVIFHIVTLFSTNLSTVVVGESTEETKIEFDGYIFRDEVPILTDYAGAVDYIAYDGLKVAAGERLATVYEQGNASSVKDSIDQLDEMIASLEESTDKSLSLSDLPEINQDANISYATIMKKLADGDISGISDNVSDMTSALCKNSVLTDKSSPVPVTLQRLYDERARIMSAGGDKREIFAEKSGYFYSDTDGYEYIFTVEAADNMTPELYRKYASADAVAQPEGQYPVGKMVYDSEWRFVSMVSAEAGRYFEEGVTYRTSFTGESKVTIPLTLTKITKAENSSLLLTFECDRMPSNFDFARMQSVELVVSSITGINVPQTAVHRRRGEYYVYILKGSVVFERRIEVIYEGDDYYTVKSGMPPDDDDVYLQSNDTLILNGKNLFDGRILE